MAVVRPTQSDFNQQVRMKLGMKSIGIISGMKFILACGYA